MLIRHVIGPVLERITLYTDNSLFPKNRFVFDTINIFLLLLVCTNQFWSKKQLWRFFWISSAFGFLLCQHNILQSIHFIRKPKTVLLHEYYVLVLIASNFVFNYLAIKISILFSLIKPYFDKKTNGFDNSRNLFKRNIILFLCVFLIYLHLYEYIAWDFFQLSQYFNFYLFEEAKEMSYLQLQKNAITANGIILLLLCTQNFTSKMNFWRSFGIVSIVVFIVSFLIQVLSLNEDLSDLQIQILGLYYALCLIIASFFINLIIVEVVEILKLNIAEKKIE